MKGMSDQEFDDFFRKAAANENIPYNPQAWKKMSAKLGKPGKSPFLNGKTISIAVLLLISLVSLTTWYFWPHNTAETNIAKTNRQQVENNAESAGDSSDPLTSERDATASANLADKTDKSNIANQAVENLSEEQEAASTGQLSELNDNAERESKPTAETRLQDKQPKSASNHLSTTQSAENKNAIAQKTVDQKSDVDVSQSPTGNQETIENAKENNQPEGSNHALSYYYKTDDFSQQIMLVSSQPLFEPAIPLHIGTIDVIPQEMYRPAADENKDVNEIIKPSSPFPRWGLSFAISPDLSNVHASPITQVGTKTGIGLEFFVFRYLSLNTGLIFTNSLYTTTGVEGYKPPYRGFWKKYDKPDNIKGQCHIVDIPIDIKFYTFQGKKSRFFVSSGLSSYLMLREKYDYVYNSYAHNQYDGYEVKNKNKHYFKVVNLSVGYERALGTQWAVEANPFVKLPLTGVGAGEIKLLNLGLFLSLHYRFGFTK